MWSCICRRFRIFPPRKLGALGDGYESSFLVLEGNPIQDFSMVNRIRLRVKQGNPLK
jgi:imidazolonepropionase-like amidohydrolase